MTDRNDRRKPLGGVDKDTFTHSADNPKLNAELTYNLISGLKSDICFEMGLIKDDVSQIKGQCSCRLEQCKKDFIGRMKIRKWSLPVSQFSFWSSIVLAGLGVFYLIEPNKFVKWAKEIFSFL